MSVQPGSVTSVPEDRGHRDPVRYAWLFFPAFMVFPLISMYLASVTGARLWYWLTPFALFVVVPILDALLDRHLMNVAQSAARRIEEDPYYRWIAWLCVPLHWAPVILGAWVISTRDLDWASWVGISLSAGIVAAFGLITAHELGHKRSRVDHWLAKFTLAAGFYGQYTIDHNRGHHRDVATPEDSGTARFGEGFWYFWLARQIPQSTALRPWRLEKQRLARKGKGPWSLENEVLQPVFISLLGYATLILLLGGAVLPFLGVVVITTYLFHGVIDYIEHYALLRPTMKDGRYARVLPRDSWNCDDFVTTFLFMGAGRHSDHHAYPLRRYQVLQTLPDLPTLPAGYLSMFWLALVPALWRSVMDPLVLRRVDHDLNQINVDPRQRQALFRKYSSVPDRSVSETVARRGASGAGEVTAGTGGATAGADHRCPGCGYTYRESAGDPSQGFAPGTPWSRIPDTWSCPDCAVRDKVDFESLPAAAKAAGD